MASWRILKTRTGKALILFSLVLFLFNILGSASRAAAISLLIFLGTLWLFSRLRRKVLVAALTLVLLVVGLKLYTAHVSRVTLYRYTGQRGSTESIVTRVGWTMQALRMAADNPWLGVGLGNFPLVQNRYFDPRTPLEPYHAHNTFLQLAAEAGIPAALLYLAIHAFCAGYLYLAVAAPKHPEDRHAALSLLAGLLAMTFFAATSNLLTSEFVWMTFAFAVVLHTLPDGRDAAPNAAEPVPVAPRERAAPSP
jgi:putative inorganic carbon (HCO3(-)) transporter